MHILFDIEEVLHADHQQERTAEGGDAGVRFRDHAGIFIRLPDGEFQCRDRIGPHGNRDNGEREDDAHAENGNDNAPGQKAVLPFRGHVAQDARIDDGVIEGKRNFQNAENRTDDEDGDHSPKVPVNS